MPTGGLDFAALGVALEGAVDATAAAIGGGIGALGVGADTALAIGTGLTDAGIGAGLGAAEAGITGSDPLKGAELGGITGGFIGGAGPALGGAFGSTGVGDVLAGAAGGAAGGAATGGNVLQDTLGGAVSGGISAALSGTTGAPSGSATTGGSAGATAAPASVGATAPGGDVTTFSSPSDFPNAPPGSTTISNINTPGAGSDLSIGSSDFNAQTSAGAPKVEAGTDLSSPSGSSNNFVNGGQSLPDPTGSGGGQSLPAGGSSFKDALAGSGLNSGGSLSSTTISNPTGGNISGNASTGGNITGGGASAASTAADTPSTISKAWDNPTFSNIGKALSANAGLLTAGAGLGTDLASALSGPPVGEKQLKTEAEQLQALGTQNAGYLNNGTLPPGIQGGINSATQSALAAIRSKYASMGMSGSSAEQADLQAAQQNAQTQGAQIAMQLMQQGASELDMSSQLYNEIIKNTMASDASFSSAFTNLASAVGGGSGGGATIKIGGAT